MAKGRKRTPDAETKKDSLVTGQEEEIVSADSSQVANLAAKPLDAPAADVQSTNDTQDAEATPVPADQQTQPPVDAPAEPKKRAKRRSKTEASDTPAKEAKPSKRVKKTKVQSVPLVEDTPKAEEAPAKVEKRGGRKPMTDTEKAAAAKKRAEEKAKADSMVPVLLLQYQGDEIDTAALIEAAKADFKAGHKRTLITDLKLYLKPEEQMAYYVVNGTISGSIHF